MDDGFQNPSLAKDFSLIVIDAAAGLGSGRVFPLGPLRAPLAFQARMADAILLLGGGTRGGDIAEQINLVLKTKAPSPQPSPARGEGVGCARCDGVPSPLAGEGQGEGAFFTPGRNVFEAQIVPRVTEEMRARPYFAFCGIRRPAKFFDTLREAGVSAVKCRAFPDHHPYTEADSRSLLAEAKALGAELITTEKDRARLRGQAGAPGELYRSASALPVRIELSKDQEASLLAAVLSRICSS